MAWASYQKNLCCFVKLEEASRSQMGDGEKQKLRSSETKAFKGSRFILQCQFVTEFRVLRIQELFLQKDCKTIGKRRQYNYKGNIASINISSFCNCIQNRTTVREFSLHKIKIAFQGIAAACLPAAQTTYQTKLVVWSFSAQSAVPPPLTCFTLVMYFDN